MSILNLLLYEPMGGYEKKRHNHFLTQHLVLKIQLKPLKSSGQLSISSVFFNLNSAETDEEIQKIAQEVSHYRVW
jgi:hypothetical protein